jgi:DNA-binding NtrC family response regulator
MSSSTAHAAKRKGRPSVIQSGKHHRGLILTFRVEGMKMNTILVLEEDHEGREALSAMLRQNGFRTCQAEREAAALAALGPGCPIDLVIAGATDRTRTDFLACLRAQRPSMPVVLLADCGDAVSRKQLLSSGFWLSRSLNFYMNTRPIDFNELDRLIRIALIPQGNAHLSRIRAV